MGRYLHYFLNNADFVKKYFAEDYEKHWASLTVSSYKSGYDRTYKKLAKTPLTLVPLTNDSTTFTFAIASGVGTDILQSISYSTDGGDTWTTTNNTDGSAVNVAVTVTNKTPVMFKGVGTAISVSDSVYSRITSNKNFAAFGNPLSLIGEKYTLNDLYKYPWAFANLFRGNTYLIYAKDVTLSAKRCGTRCYWKMFSGCTNLESFPTLPATRVGKYSYGYMFENCKKMITPPALNSTKLSSYCYHYMFSACTGLTSIPELPATNLATYCYQRMFNGCTGLTNPTITLPAMAMAQYCYEGMFCGCSNLTIAPALPATSVAPYCYNIMFQNCSKLTTGPTILPAITLESNCYLSMFNGCSKLTSVPTLPATTLALSCYNQMFKNCTSLTNPPALPATKLASNCYDQMFAGCTSLVNTPNLPATTVAQGCYANMFNGCTSITTMPTINLTAMQNNALKGMMRGCTSLVNVPDILPWTTLVSGCFQELFYDCTSLAKAPELPAPTLVANCYNSMFYNCSNINRVTALFTTNPNSVSSCNANWLYGVSATGTFIKSGDAEWNPNDYRGVSGVPENWTVQAYAYPAVMLSFSHAHIESTGLMVKGIPTTITIAPDTGYIFDTPYVEVTMNNIDVTSQCTVTTTSSLITITTPDVTGNITIEGTGTIVEM